MANCVTAQPADNKEQPRREKRYESSTEAVEPRGARRTARVWASLAQRAAQLVGSQPGLQKFTKLLQHSQSPHAEEVPGCEHSTDTFPPPRGKVQHKQHSLNAQTHAHAGTWPGSRGGKLILPCAAVYHRTPILCSPDGSLRAALFRPPFPVWLSESGGWRLPESPADTLPNNRLINWRRLVSRCPQTGWSVCRCEAALLTPMLGTQSANPKLTAS